VNVWLVVVAAGAGSYLFRVSMLVLAARVGLPTVLERAARFAVPTAFAALAATSLIGRVTTDVASVAPLAAVVVGALAVRHTGSPHAALLAGMPTFWVLDALLAV
jgi:branched-subunit amino acid transport protein